MNPLNLQSMQRRTAMLKHPAPAVRYCNLQTKDDNQVLHQHRGIVVCLRTEYRENVTERAAGNPCSPCIRDASSRAPHRHA